MSESASAAHAWRKAGFALIGTLASTLAAAQAASPVSAAVDFSTEPACTSLVPVSQGGPAPRHPNLLVLRWLGVTNEELAYRDNVFLIDAFYRRVPPARPLGFEPSDVKKATAILVNHAHGDHFADVPDVAKQTGALVIGAPLTIETALKGEVPQAQTRVVTGKGGEVLTYPGVTIEPVLSLHDFSDEYDKDKKTIAAVRSIGAKAYKELTETAGIARTPEQQAALQSLFAEGHSTNDPRLITEGTLAYLFTFASGYKLYFHAGVSPTEYEKKVLARIGTTDFAIISYGAPIPGIAIDTFKQTFRLAKPAVVMPSHHDDVGGLQFEVPTEPLLMAIRDEAPGTRAIAPLYRSPICVDLQSKKVFVGP
jgi:L-ascorbate metabolism protein UlaG (beta-lactamase superfamily)